MALPDILTGLLHPAAYPHPCATVQLIETHISWVLLTGDYAYKIKKPVRLPFVDFSTLERRRIDCAEELRCNRRFAPDLYLGVEPVCRTPAGGVGMGGSGEVVDWAVRMRQFPQAQELDHLLAANALPVPALRAFGEALATLHAALPGRPGQAGDVTSRVVGPALDNFATLEGLDLEPGERAMLAQVRRTTGQLAERLRPLFLQRFADGHVRECHGDLHLGNLVLLDGRVTAFDCLEFDANLRWIDTQSDVAFLFMDCLVRGRGDLAYGFLDGYLDASGDYEGATLLPFYTAYRAMVRAKVAGIERAQRRADSSGAPVERGAGDRLLTYLHWAERWLHRPSGGVVLMSGVSGSGKSWLAERLTGLLPAVRLRSDVARRALERLALADAGHADQQPAGEAGHGSHVDRGRYAPERVAAVYDLLGSRLAELVPQGELVILDATFISRSARGAILQRARQAGWPALILHCSAPLPVLEARIRQRQAAGHDPSEADRAVLERQLAHRDPFGPEEPVLEVDTGAPLDDRRLLEIRDTVIARLRDTSA